MTRTTDRHGTKSLWRKRESKTYGVAAHRRQKASNARAQVEHEKAKERRGEEK